MTIQIWKEKNIFPTLLFFENCPIQTSWTITLKTFPCSIKIRSREDERLFNGCICISNIYSQRHVLGPTFLTVKSKNGCGLLIRYWYWINATDKYFNTQKWWIVPIHIINLNTPNQTRISRVSPHLAVVVVILSAVGDKIYFYRFYKFHWFSEAHCWS